MTIPSELAEKLTALGIDPRPDPALPPWQGAPEMSAELRARMEGLDLLETEERLTSDGYTVIKDVFTQEECDRLAAAVKARTKVGYVKNMLFGEDPLFFEALVREKLMALAQVNKRLNALVNLMQLRGNFGNLAMGRAIIGRLSCHLGQVLAVQDLAQSDEQAEEFSQYLEGEVGAGKERARHAE